MSVQLGMSCVCGAWISEPCPEVVDIPMVTAKFAGWDHDECGFARCPQCLAGGGTILSAPDHKDGRQGELFAGEAA